MVKPTRADDERLLDMLALHDEGLTPEQIGKTMGVPPRVIRKFIRTVREHDCRADPAAAGYWYHPRRR